MASEPKEPVECGSSSSQALTNFDGFKVSRILDENCERKSICVEAQDALDRRALVLLEREPFRPQSMPTLFSSKVRLEAQLVNDVYAQYRGHFDHDDEQLHSFKANVVLPATDQHIRKFSHSPSHLIYETPEHYSFITLPSLKKQQFHTQWIQNILEHKSEQDRIIYEDPDPETGFVMLPDLKWSGQQTEDLYVSCIVRNAALTSIRDLNQSHLPLLRKLWIDATNIIKDRYGLQRSQIRAFFHYQPSYYHLHVHYTNANHHPPGNNAEKAHLLPVVMANLELCSAYYEKATLCFSVKENSALYQAYLDSGYNFAHTDPAVPEALSSLPMDFLKQLGRAKHEPCGEYWNVSYGESAWRMAVLILCLKPDVPRISLIKRALSSAFTCFGMSTDQDSEWSQKLEEVRCLVKEYLPLDSASLFYHHYEGHVRCRRGAMKNQLDHIYRHLLELEEELLLFEELQKEGEVTEEMRQVLLRKMTALPFAGLHKDGGSQPKEDQVQALSVFISHLSTLIRLKRTGWVRSKVRDPETVAGHMFRMGVLAMILQDNQDQANLDITDSAMVISIVHDLAEAVVGDLTPSDPVTPEQKHRMEMDGLKSMVANLHPSVSASFLKAFNRYENKSADDWAAKLTFDLDKFDMVMQAYEYEVKEKRLGQLDSFFTSTSRPDLFSHRLIQQWNSQLRSVRSQQLADLDVHHQSPDIKAA